MSTELSWPELINTLLEGRELSITASEWAMDEILAGRAPEAALAGFLIALRVKGETIAEIVGFRDAILQHALPLHVDPMALDIVGTGGDRFGTVNVSTTAAIVAAATGVPVIKHGGRAASSLSGSTDVLSALGLNIDLEPEQLAEVLLESGIIFVPAPKFHAGFRHAAPVRKALGVPTVFNFLGPLSNPARPEASAIGVSSAEKAPLVAGVFRTRGATALVFRGDDGLDELSTTGHSHIWEVSRGDIHEHDFAPRELGIARSTIEALRGGSPEENAQILRNTLGGEQGAVRDIVLLNAAAGLVAFRLAQDASQLARPILDRFAEGLAAVTEAIDSGGALKKLDAWAAATQRHTAK